MISNIQLDTGLRRVVLKATVRGVTRKSVKVSSHSINAGEGEHEEKRVEREIQSLDFHKRATEIANKVAAIKDRWSTYVDELDGHFTDETRAKNLTVEVEKIREEIRAFNREPFFNPATGMTERNPHPVRLVYHEPEPFGVLMTPEMTATLIGDIDQRFADVENDLALTPRSGELADSAGCAAMLTRVQAWVREAKNLPALVPAQTGAVLHDAIEAIREGRNDMAKALRDGCNRDVLLALPKAVDARDQLATARGWLVGPQEHQLKMEDLAS